LPELTIHGSSEISSLISKVRRTDSTGAQWKTISKSRRVSGEKLCQGGIETELQKKEKGI
jgi:hypothetical protein